MNPSILIDISGKKFGRWKALNYIGDGRWNCICDCGKSKNVLGYMLRRPKGGTLSSGCYMKECVSKRRRNPRGFAGVVYNDYTRNAAKWNRPFEISFEDFSLLIAQNCHYCGKIPSSKCRPVHGDWRYNGLDRVDNKKGYTLDNVVVACAICNRMKDNLSYEDFLGGINAVYEFQKNIQVKAIV